MCEYQIELRRIRHELEEILERNEKIHLRAKQRDEKGNDEKYVSYCEGYGNAIRRALQVINEPG